MLRITLRNLRAHKLRLLLSGLAVVLGVAFVAGTYVFTDTLSKTFDDLFTSTVSDVELTPAVVRQTTTGCSYRRSRPARWPRSSRSTGSPRPRARSSCRT